MKKIKINKTSFELNDETILIIQDFLGKLDIYKEKQEINSKEYKEIKMGLEDKILDQLELDDDISQEDANVIVGELLSQYKSLKPVRKRRNFVSWFFGFLYKLVMLFFQLLFLIGKIVFWVLMLILIIIGIIVFISILIILLFAVPILFLDVVVGRQEIFAIFPDAFRYSVVLFEVAIVIFLMIFVGALGKSTNGAKGFLISGMILFVLSLNGFIYSFFYTYYSHNQVFEKTEEFTFDYDEKTPIRLMGFDKFDIDLRDFYINGKLEMTDVDIRRHDGDEVFVKVITKINDASQESATEYFSKLNDSDIRLNGNQLIFVTGEDDVFKEIVPYKFLRRKVVIDVPK